MEQYASIGKLALKNAIGLQKNRKEIEYKTVSKLDEKASGCFECPIYSRKQIFKAHPESSEYYAACQACANCSHCIYSTVIEERVKYINEKNRFGTKIGYSETLKTNGLKLFLVLHMMHPNRFGHIFNLSISGLKEILGCDRKTILANLEKLKEYQYIQYVASEKRGCVNVIITGYESYFKPAQEGGRGYMVFSLELVKALLEIKDLTALRLFLHQLIDTDNYSDTAKQIQHRSYQELLGCLPGCYKPFHIRKALSSNHSPIFQLNVDDAKASVTFKLNPSYNAKKVKEELISDAKKLLIKYVDKLNDHFELINQQKAHSEDLLNEIYYINGRPKQYVPYSVSRSDLEETAKMAWQFSIHDILDAIDYIYIHFTLKKTPIDNYPGLVRTVIPEVHESHKLLSLVS